MLAAALFAMLLAQAEQAPAPAAPASPAAAPAGPAEAAPTAAPPAAAPTPPASPPPPPPSAAAPGAPVPPLVDEKPTPPANSVSVQVRYAYRVGSMGDATGPASGMSLGGEFERRFLAFDNGLELGAALDFFYDRFSMEAIAADPSGQTNGTIVDRTLSQTSFTALETTGWRYADMRLFVGIGGGLTVNYFASPDQFPGSRTALKPLACGVFGFDFAVASRTAAILRIDYNHTFNHESFAVNGMVYPLFGDVFDAGIGLLVRF